MARAEFPGIAAGAEFYSAAGCPGHGCAHETAGGYLCAITAEAALEKGGADEHRRENVGAAAGRVYAACGALQRGVSGMAGFYDEADEGRAAPQGFLVHRRAIG